MSTLPVIPISKTSNRNAGHRLTQKEERVALREWRQEMSSRLIAMEEALKSEGPNSEAMDLRVAAVEERLNSAEEALLDLADLANATDAPMEDTNTRRSVPNAHHDPPMTTLGQQSQSRRLHHPHPAPPPPPPPAVHTQHPPMQVLNMGPPAKTRADNAVVAARAPRRTRAHQLW